MLNITVKRIALAIHDKPEKIAQLQKVKDITVGLTSDDGIKISEELYNGGVIRWIITGTRSQMTITYNVNTKQIVRKARNEKPFMTSEYSNIYCYEILEYMKEIA